MLRAVRFGVSRVARLGWTVIAVSVVCWLAGVILGWDELLVIAATGLVAVLIGALSTLGRLDLTSALDVQPPRVVVGERAAGSLILTNRASRSSRAVRVELPVGRAAAVFDVPRLTAGAAHDELFVVPTHRRAIIPVGPVTTVLGDALGLFRRTHTWPEQYEIYVHPATVPLETMTAGLVRDLEGRPTSHLTASDVAFHTLRDYVPGDDRRHVHWKTSAKIGKLMVRQYVDTRRSHVCVLLSIDMADYADEDEFELSVSAAASVVLQSVRDEQTVSIVVGGQQWSVGAPKALLDRFSGIEPATGSGGIDECFVTARRVAPDASVCCLTVGSGRSVPEIRRAAARTSTDTTVLVVHCDPLGADSYRRIGTMAFVHLSKLGALRRGIDAVMAS
jgi:uncharacterized protein (DUF58 family)